MLIRRDREGELRDFFDSLDEAVGDRDVGKIVQFYHAVKSLRNLVEYPAFFRQFAKNMPVRILSQLRDSPHTVGELVGVFDREDAFSSLVQKYIIARILNTDADAARSFRQLTRRFSVSIVKARAVLAWKLFFDLPELSASHLKQSTLEHTLAVPLFQFWDSDEVPDDVNLAVSSWRNAVGAKNHILFNDRSARDFIRANCGSFLVKYYDQCFHPAMKADYFRLCFLAVQGGLYVDADSVPVGDPRRLVAAAGGRQVLVFRCDRYENRITNMFLYSPAASGIFETAVLMAAERIRRGRRLIFEDTGPGLVTDAVLRCCADNGELSGVMGLHFAALTRTLMETIPTEYKETDRNWRKARSRVPSPL